MHDRFMFPFGDQNFPSFSQRMMQILGQGGRLAAGRDIWGTGCQLSDAWRPASNRPTPRRNTTTLYVIGIGNTSCR